MKNILFLLAICTAPVWLCGQSSHAYLYGGFFSAQTARYQPAMLGSGYERFGLTIGAVDAGFENNAVSRGFLTSVGAGDFQGLPVWVDGLPQAASLRAHLQAEALSGFLRVGKQPETGFTIGWSLAERALIKATLPGDLARLVWYGNEPYEDQHVHMDVSFRGLWTREFGISGAGSFLLGSPDARLRVGGRLRYLQGIHAARVYPARASVYTAPDGQYIDMEYHFAAAASFDPESETPFFASDVGRPRGSGYAADLGARFSWKKFLHADVSLIDMGMVRFQPEARNVVYEKTGELHFEGAVIEQPFESPTPRIDSSVFDRVFMGSRATHTGLYMPLPARVRMGCSVTAMRTDKQGRPYAAHTLSVAIASELNVGWGYATYFESGYTFNLKNALELSVTGGGGDGHWYAGAFAGLRAGPVRWGLGSANLSAALSAKGKGIGLTSVLAAAF